MIRLLLKKYHQKFHGPLFASQYIFTKFVCQQVDSSLALVGFTALNFRAAGQAINLSPLGAFFATWINRA